MQDRLRVAFSQTLSDTVESEGRRLTAELDDAAQRAMSELPQLRQGLTTGATHLARAARAIEAITRENADLRADNVRLERQLIEHAEQAAATTGVRAAKAKETARRIDDECDRSQRLEQVRHMSKHCSVTSKELLVHSHDAGSSSSAGSTASRRHSP